ncbi:hypothetical protein CPB83DRAFT_173198 [Crepidotus variabilis]|uniref:Uncharacterized protein n=1 Tax=Crepidotus variabilis TaxID=179855 RepID=A0A9P6E3F0_9AGAR|nr:hypothetical protein CPB83DRAFT_173198 [Crepidotus variabilis]
MEEVLLDFASRQLLIDSNKKECTLVLTVPEYFLVPDGQPKNGNDGQSKESMRSRIRRSRLSFIVGSNYTISRIAFCPLDGDKNFNSENDDFFGITPPLPTTNDFSAASYSMPRREYRLPRRFLSPTPAVKYFGAWLCSRLY